MTTEKELLLKFRNLSLNLHREIYQEPKGLKYEPTK